MSVALKTLAQSTPGNTLTALYTVPVATSALISSITVCNCTDENQTFRLRIAADGGADDTKHAIYHDEVVRPGRTFVATLGITVQAAGVIRALASSSLVAFNVFGKETA